MTTTARTKGARPVRVVIYCRMSLARHGDTVKVKRQERLCRRLAKSLGWEVVHVFCDNNKSAWKRNRQRPDWDEMLKWIDDGRADAVIFYHGDRLIRQPWDLEMLLNLADGRGIKLASPTGTRNLDDPDDRYRLRQDVAKACNESDTISRRTKVVHEERARLGKRHKGGYRPFGYKRSGKPHPVESEQYRDAAARLLAGESRTSVLKTWNGAGVLTTPGNPWQYTAFTKMMSNPRYAGLSVYRGKVVGVGKWEALIDREAWEALQVVLGVGSALYTPVRPAANHSASKYLLPGIATHAACGGKIKAHLDTRPDQTAYICANPECTQRIRRNMANADAFVVGYVLRILSDPLLWEEIEAARAADEDLAPQLVALKMRRQAVLDRFAKSAAMSEAELDGLLREMNRRIEALQERIAERAGRHLLDGCRDMTREQWDGTPLDRRRALVRGLVTVELLPARRGRGFDVESVRVARRRGGAAAGKGGSGVMLELVGGPAPE